MNEELYDYGRKYNLDFMSLDILVDILKRTLINYSLAIKNCLRKLIDLEKPCSPCQDKTEYDDTVTWELSKKLGMTPKEHTVLVFLVKAQVYRDNVEVQKSYMRMCLSLLVSLKQRYVSCSYRGHRFFDTILCVGPDFETWKKRLEFDLEDIFSNEQSETESEEY